MARSIVRRLDDMATCVKHGRCSAELDVAPVLGPAVACGGPTTASTQRRPSGDAISVRRRCTVAAPTREVEVGECIEKVDVVMNETVAAAVVVNEKKRPLAATAEGVLRTLDEATKKARVARSASTHVSAAGADKQPQDKHAVEERCVFPPAAEAASREAREAVVTARVERSVSTGEAREAVITARVERSVSTGVEESADGDDAAMEVALDAKVNALMAGLRATLDVDDAVGEKGGAGDKEARSTSTRIRKQDTDDELTALVFSAAVQAARVNAAVDDDDTDDNKTDIDECITSARTGAVEAGGGVVPVDPFLISAFTPRREPPPPAAVPEGMTAMFKHWNEKGRAPDLSFFRDRFIAEWLEIDRRAPWCVFAETHSGAVPVFHLRKTSVRIAESVPMTPVWHSTEPEAAEAAGFVRQHPLIVEELGALPGDVRLVKICSAVDQRFWAFGCATASCGPAAASSRACGCVHLVARARRYDGAALREVFIIPARLVPGRLGALQQRSIDVDVPDRHKNLRAEEALVKELNMNMMMSAARGSVSAWPGTATLVGAELTAFKAAFVAFLPWGSNGWYVCVCVRVCVCVCVGGGVRAIVTHWRSQDGGVPLPRILPRDPRLPVLGKLLRVPAPGGVSSSASSWRAPLRACSRVPLECHRDTARHGVCAGAVAAGCDQHPAVPPPQPRSGGEYGGRLPGAHDRLWDQRRAAALAGVRNARSGAWCAMIHPNARVQRERAVRIEHWRRSVRLVPGARALLSGRSL